MSFQFSGELGEFGDQIAKAGKDIITSSRRSAHEFLLKKVEGLTLPNSEQVEKITTHLGQNFIDFCLDNNLEILVPDKLFARTGNVVHVSSMHEMTGAKSQKEDTFRFGFFDAGRWVDFKCTNLELYKDSKGDELLEPPKKIVKMDFMFTEDQLKRDIERHNLDRVTLGGRSNVDRAQIAMAGYLQNRRGVGLDITTTIGFLRKSKGLITSISPDCFVTLYPADRQRARIYRAGLKELPNVTINVPESD